MKIYKTLSIIMMGAAIAACNENPAAGDVSVEGTDAAEEAVTAPEDIKFSKGEIDSVSYLVGIQFGSFLKGYDFGKLNNSLVKKGIKDQLNAQGSPRDTNFFKQFKVSPELTNEIFGKYLDKRHELKVAENRVNEQKFLADYAAKDGVQKTEDGVLYTIVEKGNDVIAAETDTVWVNYKGTLESGDTFDETPEGSEPIMMLLGRVIPGWRSALSLIGEGGEIDVCIPSELAYGEYGANGIEPCSPLMFNIKLSRVGKYVAPADESK